MLFYGIGDNCCNENVMINFQLAFIGKMFTYANYCIIIQLISMVFK